MDRSSPGVLTHSQLHVEQRDPQHNEHQEVWHQKGTWQEINQLNTYTEKGLCDNLIHPAWIYNTRDEV